MLDCIPAILGRKMGYTLTGHQCVSLLVLQFDLKKINCGTQWWKKQQRFFPEIVWMIHSFCNFAVTNRLIKVSYH